MTREQAIENAGSVLVQTVIPSRLVTISKESAVMLIQNDPELWAVVYNHCDRAAVLTEKTGRTEVYY